MDAYQGSVYDPVSLHKYLYCSANPVMNIDPSGYMGMTIARARYDMATLKLGMQLILQTKTAKIVGAIVFTLAIIPIIHEVSELPIFSNYSIAVQEHLIDETFAGIGDVAKDPELVKKKEDFETDIRAKVKADTKNRGSNTVEHHIVSRKHRKAEPSRDILKKVKIEIESSQNKVMLSTKMHVHMHTNVYYIWLNSTMIASYNMGSEEEAQLNVSNALLLVKTTLITIDTTT
jgi:hypothetical protein